MSGHRTRPHLRVCDRQDQFAHVEAAHALGLVHRLRHLIRVCEHLAVRHRLSRADRHRRLGQQHSGRLGLRHHQLRLVDRHRACGHTNFGDPFALASIMAHFDQPLRRSDDSVCRLMRRHLPSVPHGAALARHLLALPLSEHDEHLAELPQPSDVGRVRGLDLRHCLGAVLVRWPDPGLCHLARPRAVEAVQDRLRHSFDGLARLGAALGAL